jgi:hypothetical protein
MAASGSPQLDPVKTKRLGVFWHTQGSGKSLSMVFFTEKIHRKVPGKWTFVVVTDREELMETLLAWLLEARRSARRAVTGCGRRALV